MRREGFRFFGLTEVGATSGTTGRGVRKLRVVLAMSNEVSTSGVEGETTTGNSARAEESSSEDW